MHLAPGGLGCCPLWGCGSVVVDLLFIVTPIVGICNCSMFCCALLNVPSSIWLLCLVCIFFKEISFLMSEDLFTSINS